MQRKIKTPEGDIMYLSETIKLGHGISDKNHPEAYNKIWVLHNTEGPALLKSDGTKEYYFWGVFKGNSYEAIRELKKDQNGTPPAKNPLFKDR